MRYREAVGRVVAGAMEEGANSRFEFEQHDGWRLKYFAGQPGNYVGVTKHKGKTKTTYYARASVTKRKGDKRRQSLLVLLVQRLLLPSPSRRRRAIRAARPRQRARESPAHVRCLPLATCLDFLSDAWLLVLSCARSQINPRPARHRPDQRR